MPPEPVAPTSRRSLVARLLLVGAAGALAVGGCSGAEPDGSAGPGATDRGPGTTTIASAAGPGSPAVRWVRVLSGPSNEDEIDGVAGAPDGSAYVTGKFERSTELGGSRLESAGAADIPLARFDANGGVRWVQRFGGPGEDNLFDVDASSDGAVASGWFEGTVAFDDVTLTSAGSTDCVVVAFDGDGRVRWARSFGGPGPDGCNEIVVADDGAVTTTIDTSGDWVSPAGPLPATARPDSLVLRLDGSGAVAWARLVAGPGWQRAKAVAVGPDGDVVVGGDSVGDLVVDGLAVDAPGAGADAWLARWSDTGALEWAETWGGPGDDLVKGLAADGSSVYAVGPFTGAVEVGGNALDAGTSTDLAVVRFSPDGELRWATSVAADEPLTGAEVVGTGDGGVLFGSWLAPGTALRSPTGATTAVDATAGGTAWIGAYRADGSVSFASTIPGTAGGGPDEVGRTGDRIYLDLVVRGSGNVGAGIEIEADGKDGSLWAIDVAGIGG